MYRNSHKQTTKVTMYHTSSDSKSTPLDVWLCEPLLPKKDTAENLKKKTKKVPACYQMADISESFPSSINSLTTTNNNNEQNDSKSQSNRF